MGMKASESHQLLSLRLPVAAHSILKEIAFYEDEPMNTIILDSIIDKLEQLINRAYQDRNSGGEIENPKMTKERRDYLIGEAQKLKKQLSVL